MSLRTVRARSIAQNAKTLAERILSQGDAAEVVEAMHLAAANVIRLADAVADLADEADELELTIDHRTKKEQKPRAFE